MAEDKSVTKIVEAFLKDYLENLESEIAEIVNKILMQKFEDYEKIIQEKAQKKLIEMKGAKGDKPLLGVDYIIPNPIPGPPGAPGKDADERKIVADVLKQIPPPIQGEPGEPGKDGTEIPGEEIVSKINKLEVVSEKQIDAKHIKNLPKYDKYGKGMVLKSGIDIGLWLNGGQAVNNKLIVSDTQPTDPILNDLWVDTA